MASLSTVLEREKKLISELKKEREILQKETDKTLSVLGKIALKRFKEKTDYQASVLKMAESYGSKRDFLRIKKALEAGLI